jgi:hypothetical protein
MSTIRGPRVLGQHEDAGDLRDGAAERPFVAAQRRGGSGGRRGRRRAADGGQRAALRVA